MHEIHSFFTHFFGVKIKIWYNHIKIISHDCGKLEHFNPYEIEKKLKIAENKGWMEKVYDI